MAHTILRLPAVRASTGLSRSTIYLRVAEGSFPQPVSLGGRAVGWLEAEIQDWLQRRIEASRNVNAERRASRVRYRKLDVEQHVRDGGQRAGSTSEYPSQQISEKPS